MAKKRTKSKQTKFRFKRETSESRAWRYIAERVEEQGGTGSLGLCSAIRHWHDRHDGPKSVMEERLYLLSPKSVVGYWWDICSHERTLAAWFLYWMSRS